jgi:hypothetical protein
MTRAQINAFLTELNSQYNGMYTLDTWLELEEVSEIVLYSDANLYPDETVQYYFDDDTELLLSRVGSYNAEGDWTTTRDVAAISYSLIIGFMLAKPTSRKSPYKLGAMV